MRGHACRAGRRFASSAVPQLWRSLAYTPPMSEDRDLGLDTPITRKDFLNATLLGVGGVLISAAAPGLVRAAEARAERRRRLDRLRRRRRLRAVERQHEGRAGRGAQSPRPRLRHAAPQHDRHRRALRRHRRRRRHRGTRRRLHRGKDDESREDVPGDREPSDLRRRRQAERIPRQRRAPRRAAGVEPVRRAGRRPARRSPASPGTTSDCRDRSRIRTSIRPSAACASRSTTTRTWTA